MTHFDEEGRPRMVDVGDKPRSERSATAEGYICMAAETLDLVERHQAPKGDPLVVARIAGIQAAKKTAELIPLCHPLALTHIEVETELDRDRPGIRVTATARVLAETGVEMEALTAAATALLTVYDMLKAADRGMTIEGLRLIRKSGGRSGEWRAEP